MRPYLLSLLLLGSAALAAQSTPDAPNKFSPALREALARGEQPDVLVDFAEKADLSAAAALPTKSAKAHFVHERLQATAARSQARALHILRARGADVNGLFLVNALAVQKADADLLQALAELPEVRAISPDPWAPMPMPAEEAGSAAQRNTVEWGIERINAPLVWSMGYTGQGITIGGADTGYDWVHPALQGKYRGWDSGSGSAQHAYHWHDAIHETSPLSNPDAPNPCGLDTPAPCDDGAHGTHTMGTMTGDDELGNQIGVAPGARWVGCRNMERGNGKPSTYLECFQWFLAPTDAGGQNADPDQAPHVINNSWYCSVGEGCVDLTVNELLRQAVIALKASGVVVVVSNGNSGGQGCASTFGPPAYFEESFSVGSTRLNDTISGFSSRGPVLLDGSNRVKPNVSAPGSGVRSCTPGGNYANFSGTSMAGPHVAGLVALLLSARPDLAGQVARIETIIQETAVFKADHDSCSTDIEARPNNTYGWGRVDALAALNAFLDEPSSATNGPEQPNLQVHMWPNPASSGQNLRFDYQMPMPAGDCTLEIMGSDGRLLLQANQPAQAQGSFNLRLDNASPGIYLWRLRCAKGQSTGKLSVRR